MKYQMPFLESASKTRSHIQSTAKYNFIRGTLSEKERLVGLLTLFTVKELLGIDGKHGYYFSVRLSSRLTSRSWWPPLFGKTTTREKIGFFLGSASLRVKMYGVPTDEIDNIEFQYLRDHAVIQYLSQRRTRTRSSQFPRKCSKSSQSRGLIQLILEDEKGTWTLDIFSPPFKPRGKPREPIFITLSEAGVFVLFHYLLLRSTRFCVICQDNPSW